VVIWSVFPTEKLCPVGSLV